MSEEFNTDDSDLNELVSDTNKNNRTNIWPSMRKQVITGSGAEKVREMLEKSRAQKGGE